MNYQPPVYSPLGLREIATGLRAAVGGESASRHLEELLAERFAAERVVLTSSGTHALQLALMAFADRGEASLPVALPGYSCFDLVTAAGAAGVRIRFYDVHPGSLTPDLASLQTLIDEGISCVVAGNLYGYPLDFPALRSACVAAGVPLVEDAAQGVGTRTPEGVGGSLGDASVLSFGRGKGWTGGGGGALLLRGERGVNAAHEPGDLDSGESGLRSGVVTLVAWALGRPSVYRLPASIPWLGLGTTLYHEPSPATGITSFSARLAIETARDAFSVPALRRAVAESWAVKLAESDLGVTACEPVGGTDQAGFLRLPVLAESADRAESIAEACASLGVARGYPTPLHLLPEGRSLHAAEPGPLPGSEQLASCLLTLPTHQWIDERTMDRFVSTLRRRAD